MGRRAVRKALRGLTPSRRTWVALGASALVAATAASSAAPPRPRASVDDLRMSAAIAFDGLFDEGRWVEAMVRLQNAGPHRNVALRARHGATTAVVPVELPGGADVRVPLAIRTERASFFERPESIVLTAHQDGRVVTSRRYALHSTRGQPIVAYVGDNPGEVNHFGIGILSGAWDAKVVGTRMGSLPERALAMLSVDQIVLAQADPRAWRAGQLEALHEWVALGGQLVLTGGPDLPARLAALPDALRPAEVEPTVASEGAPRLASPEMDLTLRDRASIDELRPVDGAAVLATMGDSSAPLVVARGVGDGQVVALGFDPIADRMAGWAYDDDLWRWLGFQRPDTSQPGVVDVSLLADAALQSVEPPRRRFWPPVQTYDTSSVRVVAGAGIAHVTAYIALLSPVERDYTVEVPGALAFPRSSLHLGKGEADGFGAETVTAWPVGDAGRLVESGGKVTGVVRNPFGRPLVGAELIVAGDHLWIGDLPVGFERTIDRPYVPPRSLQLDLALLPPDGRDRAEEQRRRLQILAAHGTAGNASESGAVIPPHVGAELFAFGDASVLEPRIDARLGRRDAHVLFRAAVPLSHGTAEPVEIPASIEPPPGDADPGCAPTGVTLDDAGELDAVVTFDLRGAGFDERRRWLALECPEGVVAPDGRADLALHARFHDGADWRPLGYLLCGGHTWVPPRAHLVDAASPETLEISLRLVGAFGKVSFAGFEDVAAWRSSTRERGGSYCWVPTLFVGGRPEEARDG